MKRTVSALLMSSVLFTLVACSSSVGEQVSSMNVKKSSSAASSDSDGGSCTDNLPPGACSSDRVFIGKNDTYSFSEDNTVVTILRKKPSDSGSSSTYRTTEKVKVKCECTGGSSGSCLGKVGYMTVGSSTYSYIYCEGTCTSDGACMKFATNDGGDIPEREIF